MNCPYCGIQIELIEINCGILRCGIYKNKKGNIKQLPKHASKEKIDSLKPYIVLGCGMPIKYNNNQLIPATWDD